MPNFSVRNCIARLLRRYARSQNAHLPLSKLRFFEFRVPKISPCYTVSRYFGVTLTLKMLISSQIYAPISVP